MPRNDCNDVFLVATCALVGKLKAFRWEILKIAKDSRHNICSIQARLDHRVSPVKQVVMEKWAKR